MTTTDTTGVGLIAAERRRQRFTEGFRDEHDDEHDDGELIAAARTYLSWDEQPRLGDTRPIKWRRAVSQYWPWSPEWFKPADNDPIRNLTKAGALIAAEIDRLIRIKNRQEA